MSHTIKVVFVRHGESEFNKMKRFCGWYDADLTSKGREDILNISAAALIDHKMSFDCAYTSVLKRAQNTLAIILEALGQTHIPITYDWRLNERHCGDLSGYEKSIVNSKYGKDQVRLWRCGFDVPPPPSIKEDNPCYFNIQNNPRFACIPSERFPKTESLKDVKMRVATLWDTTIAKDIMCGKRVLIVAHSVLLRTLIKYLENASNSDERLSSVRIPNSIPFAYDIDRMTGKAATSYTYLTDYH